MITEKARAATSVTPTHVLDLACPNKCGAVIRVPAVEISRGPVQFGADTVSQIYKMEAPTMGAQILKHLMHDCEKR